MAWEEPRKTGMAYRRLGIVDDDSTSYETPSSDVA